MGRVNFLGNQAVASNFDRRMDGLGSTVAGRRQVGTNKDVNPVDLGDGLHRRLRRESNPDHLG